MPGDRDIPALKRLIPFAAFGDEWNEETEDGSESKPGINAGPNINACARINRCKSKM
jgi:hypothetical protein